MLPGFQAVKYIEPQIRLAAKVGKAKKEYRLSMMSNKTLEKVSNLAQAPIEAVFTDPTYGKVVLFSLSCSLTFSVLPKLVNSFSHHIYLFSFIITSSLNVGKH